MIGTEFPAWGKRALLNTDEELADCEITCISRNVLHVAQSAVRFSNVPNVIDKLEVQNSQRLKTAYQATSDVLLVMMMHFEVQT